MLPDGLRYLDSWVDERLERCFQLMETDDARLFDEWIARWSDLADFRGRPGDRLGRGGRACARLG